MDQRSQHELTPVFFVPFRRDGITLLPERVEDYWSWIVKNRHVGEGKYSWTLQTYLNLKSRGIRCELSETFPEKGIVLSHRDMLPVSLVPRPNVFLVCIKPDRKEHTWAQFHVVQNDHDQVRFSKKREGKSSVMPFWPQPSLRVRDPARGDRCENVAYFGRVMNLAPDLRSESWSRCLTTLGFRWTVVDMDHWHDYANVDVTVSVRSFDANELNSNPITTVDSKPPTKLVNSWLAGVPALVGAESAYRTIRRCPSDFIEVKSVTDLKEQLIHLRSNPDFYRAMVSNGRKRSREFSSDAVSAKWQRLLTEEVRACHEEWCRKSNARKWVSIICDMSEYFSRVQNWKDLAAIWRKAD